MIRLRQMVSVAAATCLAAGLAVATAPAAAASADPRVVAADGTEHTIDAIDPGNRAEGLLALYTPEFGPSTRTNEWGAEAILEPSEDGARLFTVTGVCTVWGDPEGQCDGPGDNAIPEGGYVLSASPGGSDPRTFIRDHISVGDVVTVDTPVLRDVTTTLHVTDPTAESNPEGVDPSTGECFPGCRGAGQMIQYTPDFGSSTGTNQFGYEVSVVDGRVVHRGGSDNVIPDDGYVLSGHGASGDWLATNAITGARVEIDGSTLRVVVDAEAYIIGARQALNQGSESFAEGQAACLAMDDAAAESRLAEAQGLLDEAEEAVEGGDEHRAVEFAERAETAAQQAWYATGTTRTLETRGIWVRPVEESPAAIRDSLDTIADAGFTTVYLETFYQGYTIFPSDTATEYGVEPQRPQFAHFDPLTVWVEEAHKRGLELHGWVHSFFVGSDATGGPGPILDVHPEWAAVERGHVGADGPMPSTAEAGYYFVDPAMPEPKEYLHAVFDEITTEYEVDGLHLDYIRYPISLPVEVSFSYSDYSRAAFEDANGMDPLDIEPGDAAWADWTAWRQDQVTSFVSETRERLDSDDRDVVLSAAVFPDQFDAEERKAQDWAGWSEAGLVDMLAGMSFGGSPTASAEDARVMLDATSDSTLVVLGTYAPHSALPPDTMVDQISAARAAGVHGVALFAYNQLTSRQAEALELGPFREPAVSADRLPVPSAITGLTDLRERSAAVHDECFRGGAGRAFGERLGAAITTLEQALKGDDGALRGAERQLRNLAGWTPGRVESSVLAAQLEEELRRSADVVAYARLHISR